jgi:hypothetical protein
VAPPLNLIADQDSAAQPSKEKRIVDTNENVGNELPAPTPDPTVQPAMPQLRVREGRPPMNPPADVPIGIPRGASPMEDLPQTIPARGAKKGG